MAAGVGHLRVPQIGDVRTAYGAACRPLIGTGMPAREIAALAARLVAEAEEEVARSGPLRHRAQADAERLRATWLAVRERVGAVVVERVVTGPAPHS